jgi:hypothetical protein
MANSVRTGKTCDIYYGSLLSCESDFCLISKENIMAEHTKIARRTLFAGLGLAAVAGIAAKLTPKSPPIEAAVAPDKEPDSYRLTEHIKKYYRSTTI